MTQDVLLTITGLHDIAELSEEEDAEVLEVIAPARYYRKNGKHYILYEEVVEGIPGVINNRIKISGEQMLEIMKSGITNAHMVFEKNRTNVTYYETPFGQMQMWLSTRKIAVHEEDNQIQVEVEYSMDINHEAQAECRISMDIRPKTAGETVLQQRATS